MADATAGAARRIQTRVRQIRRNRDVAAANNLAFARQQLRNRLYRLLIHHHRVSDASANYAASRARDEAFLLRGPEQIDNLSLADQNEIVVNAVNLAVERHRQFHPNVQYSRKDHPYRYYDYYVHFWYHSILVDQYSEDVDDPPLLPHAYHSAPELPEAQTLTLQALLRGRTARAAFFPLRAAATAATRTPPGLKLVLGRVLLTC